MRCAFPSDMFEDDWTLFPDLCDEDVPAKWRVCGAGPSIRDFHDCIDSLPVESLTPEG